MGVPRCCSPWGQNPMFLQYHWGWGGCEGEGGKGERSGRGDPSTMWSDSMQLKGKRMKYLAECQSAPFSFFLFIFFFFLPSSLPTVHENGKVCEEFPHFIFQLAAIVFWLWQSSTAILPCSLGRSRHLVPQDWWQGWDWVSSTQGLSMQARGICWSDRETRALPSAASHLLGGISFVASLWSAGK